MLSKPSQSKRISPICPAGLSRRSLGEDGSLAQTRLSSQLSTINSVKVRGSNRALRTHRSRITFSFILLNSYFLDGLIRTVDQARGKVGLISTFLVNTFYFGLSSERGFFGYKKR